MTLVLSRPSLFLAILVTVICLSQPALSETHTCNDCESCSNYTQNSSSGDMIQLTSDLSGIQGNCIEFYYQDNVTFDCQGHYIEGDLTGSGYGIKLNATALNEGSDNNTIINCNISGFHTGIYIEYSNSTVLTNTISNSNVYDGIYMYYVFNNTLEYVTSNNNSGDGVLIQDSISNIITNSTFQENGEADFYIDASADSDCENTLQNITGSGERPIEFYNHTATIQDKDLSELILCNADDSTIDNVTIRGSDSLQNNFLFLYRTDNATVSNANSSENYNGIRIFYGNGNILTNITANNNSERGIFISCFNTTLTNVNANHNIQGIYLYSSSNNTFTNVTIKNNINYGLYIYSDSDHNTINDSHIEDNSLYGIYLLHSGSNIPEYNLIHNNYLNNTNSYHNSTVLTSYFNTTRDCSSGPNIIGGPCIGGNYWTDPDGSNFSDGCTDSDSDGICDSAYSPDTGNYDYLPLTYNLPTILLESPDDDTTNTTDRILDFRFNVSGWYSTYNCTLYTNRTDTGTGFPILNGYNSSTQNDTSTTLTSGPFSNGQYDWWVNCTDDAGNTNQSDVMNVSIEVTELACNSCSSCLYYIQNSLSGDVISLTSDLSGIQGNCIEFYYQDNVTFDCQGHYIEGDLTGSDYGIYLNATAMNEGSDNNTITNCNITRFHRGIYIENSDNNTITNIITRRPNAGGSGMRIENSNGNTLFNITSVEKTGGMQNTIGINVFSGHDNNLTLINASYNDYGIYLHQTENNVFKNITVQENNRYDIYIEAPSASFCSHVFEGVNGSGGRPIEFYNYTTTIEDRDDLSELILCNADASTVNNVTIRGSDSLKNNVLYVIITDDTAFSNINSSENYAGIDYSVSHNNTLTNITASYNQDDGIHFTESDNNTLTNIKASYNLDNGIYFFSYCNNNTLTNIKASYNLDNGIYLEYLVNSTVLTNVTAADNSDYGIHFYRESCHNTVNGSRIENNNLCGIYFENLSSSKPEYNLIHDNYFNNTQNCGNATILVNYFNTTRDCSSGPNIIGGPCIGGNYWTDPDGSNFSDGCTDSDGDGICDSAYSPDTGNYDYLPLTYTIPTISLESPKNNTNTMNPTPDFTFNVSGWYPLTYNCTVYAGNGTLYQMGSNDTVLNGTSTTVTGAWMDNGTYFWYVSCTDNTLGRGNQSGTRTITIDTEEPTIVIGSPLNQSYNSGFDLNLTTGEPADSCLCNLDGGLNATLLNDSMTNWFVEVIPPSDGTHQLNVYCNDTAGNMGLNGSVWLTYDSTEPAVNLEYPANDSTNTSDRTPDIIFNATDNLAGTLSCGLFMNRTDTGTGAPAGYGINGSVLNDTSTTITANQSLVNGCYDWWVNCTDDVGNMNQSETRSITISVSDQDDNGDDDDDGGGGSGGTFTLLDTSLVATKTWFSISSGDDKTFDISKDQIPLDSVTYRTTYDATSATMRVEKLNSAPPGTGAPPGIIYSYLIITLTGVTNSHISSASAEFFVNRSWVTSNDVDPDTMNLYRYSGNEWHALGARMTSSDTAHYHFNSVIPGFSTFAITGMQSSVTPPVCDDDGICDQGETESGCPNDCTTATPDEGCTDNSRRCNGKTLETCVSGKWYILEECTGSCRNNACMPLESSGTSALLLYIVVIALALAFVVLLFMGNYNEDSISGYIDDYMNKPEETFPSPASSEIPPAKSSSIVPSKPSQPDHLPTYDEIMGKKKRTEYE